MSNFTSDLTATHLNRKHKFAGKWLLERDLVYVTNPMDGFCKKITARQGFITDGGSFNNWLVPMVGSQTGDYFESYVIHDALARRKDKVTWKESNEVLEEALTVQNMPYRKIRRVRWGLTLFGSPTKDPLLLTNAEEFVEIESVVCPTDYELMLLIS